jgi:hypothetical protein
MIFLNVLDVVPLSNDDKGYFGVDPEFLTSRYEYLISVPLTSIYVIQAPLIMGSSIVCVRWGNKNSKAS